MAGSNKPDVLEKVNWLEGEGMYSLVQKCPREYFHAESRNGWLKIDEGDFWIIQPALVCIIKRSSFVFQAEEILDDGKKVFAFSATPSQLPAGFLGKRKFAFGMAAVRNHENW